MLILLRHQAVGNRFDPESIHIRWQDWDNRPHWTTLEADTEFSHSRRIHLGKLTIRDRTGDLAEFFAFGGTLEADSFAGETVYSLRSSAPVLTLITERETAVDQLAAETMSLLTQIEAQHGWDEQTLLIRALRYRPDQLYLATLTSLWQHDEKTAILRQSHPALHHLLETEKAWFTENGLWSDDQPALADLFTLTS